MVSYQFAPSTTKAAIATVNGKWWNLLFARWLGNSVVVHEGHSVCTIARWKGVWYLIKYVDSAAQCTCVEFPKVRCRYCGDGK